MKINPIFLLIVGFLGLSCDEEFDPPRILPPVPGGTREIYQLAKVHAPDIPVKDMSFTGFIGMLKSNWEGYTGIR